MLPAPVDLLVPFNTRGHAGVISVAVSRNTDPASMGCPTAAAGFPVCQATVSFGGAGYKAMLGWVQLVGTTRSQATTRTFEVDPLRIWDGLDTPFCFFGIEPTLFDAPSRRDRQQSLDWLAHSFLCASSTDPMDRQVVALAGFTWGFVLRDGDVDLVGAQALEAEDWMPHLAMLGAKFPTWRFGPSVP
jgi:hypothetical protein